MTRRWRIVSFGSAGLLVITGAVVAVLLSGGAGPLAAMVLIGLGLVLAVGLAFLEVGLSEDRERERERTSTRPPGARRITRMKRPAIERSRGHRRRLR